MCVAVTSLLALAAFRNQFIARRKLIERKHEDALFHRKKERRIQ